MWLGLFLISMTWLFSLRIFVSQNYWAVALLTVAGVASAAVALSKSKIDFTSFNKKYYLLLLPLAVIWLLLPFPYDLGSALLFVGLAVVPLSPRWRWLPAISLGLFFSGGILTAQSLLPHIYTVFTSKSHEFAILSPVIYGLLDFLKLPVSLSQGTVFVSTMRELYAVTTTWDRMALFPFLNLLVGGGILIWLFPKEDARQKRDITLAWFFIAGVIYLVVRYIFMVLLFVYLMYFVGYYEDVIKVSIFWSPAITAVSFLPFWLLLRKLFPLAEVAENIKRKWLFHAFSRQHLLAGALLCLSAFLIVGSIGFQDPGAKKPGRLLIDEKHSEWEISYKKYDTEWYGTQSGYNYYCMADYLSHHYQVDRNFEEITPELLSRYDVLILKIPTAPFSSEEVEAIVQFVKRGGGLWLLGEHTNVFGSSVYLNPIAKRFGFTFRYDCLFDIERKFEQVYTPSKHLPHPIAQNMPPFLFAVSCSIQPDSYLAQKVVMATGLYSLGIDYHAANFYPQVKQATNMDFGSFVQIIAAKQGKGRVVGFTDSTVFSNFAAFIPGKPELLLGTVDWLNRENRLSLLNILMLLIAIFCLALAFLILRKLPRDLRFVSLVVIAGVCIIAIGISLFTTINRANYPLPEPHTKPTRVYFEKEHSDYELPILGFVKDYEKSYEIFYQWVLRLGYFPGVGPSLQDCFEKGDLTVIINPQRDFSIPEIAAAKQYVSRGGKILLMDDPSNDKSSANSLLQAFGMTISRKEAKPYNAIVDVSVRNLWPFGDNYVSPIRGGTPLLLTGEGQPILSITREGEGTLAVMTFSRCFASRQMGTIERVEPDARLRRIFDLEFSIIRGLINNNLEMELTTPVGGDLTSVVK